MREDVPNRFIVNLPVLLKECRVHVAPEPIALVCVSGMLHEAYTAIVFVEPIHLFFVGREVWVHIPSVYRAPVVVVLFDVGVQVKLGNAFHDRVQTIISQHYYVRLVLRAVLLR